MAIDEFIGTQPSGATDRSRPSMEHVRPADSSRPGGGTPWRRSYDRRLAVTDFVVLVCVVFGTQLTWLGLDKAVAAPSGVGVSTFPYWAFSTGLVLAWMLALGLIDSRTHRVIGTGSTEYVRVMRASVQVFGVIAIFAFILRVDIARGYLLISLPAGILLLLAERWAWRQWLVAQRRKGEFCARVLLVGAASSVVRTADELHRLPEAGYRVVGACVPHGHAGTSLEGIPILGGVDDVERVLRETRTDTVTITSTDHLPPTRVKAISWALESGKQHLVLAPSIMDVAGPRIHTRPVAGLPLMHVETPRFSAGQRFVKRMFDLIATAALVLLLSPVFLIVAILVKGTSRGPVFYSHERIGLHGHPFKMYKFRSMRQGADSELALLLESQGTSQTPLFKVKDDPRITPVGRVLRKYSLDELPQLFNVLGGSMSLVGPRPQIDAEVALYSDAAMRRLLTRPGISGLWQVSGRSTLSWDDTVRLDLYYVENWSLIGDLAILMKTVKAVVAPGESAH